jgi:hypothetical protein
MWSHTGQATSPNRRKILDSDRVFIETPWLMTDTELADVLAAFVAEVRADSQRRRLGRRKSDPSPCARYETAGRGHERFKRADDATPNAVTAYSRKKITRNFRTDDGTVTPG